MPRTIEQSLNLFPISGTEPIEEFRMEDLRGFQHSTVLPGGFGSLSFTISTTEAGFWQWRTDRTVARLLLQEHGGRTIWEGRLEIIELLQFWLVKLTFKGYWSNFTDGYKVAAGNRSFAATGDAIIQEIRDTQMHADTLQLSTSNAQMESPGVTITIDFDEDDWNLWRVLTDAGKGIVNIPNSSDEKMDLAVWDGRVIYYTARNPTVVTWESFISSGVSNLPVRTDWQEVANVTIGRYDNAGTRTDTTYVVDTASIAKSIRRERVLPYLGDGSSVASADAQAASELALRKDLQQQTDSLVLTQVWDVNDVEFPLCRVRAGDVLRIPDFTPKTGDLDAVTLDGYRTFFIESTSCDHTRGTLTLRPDRHGTSMSGLLTRAGVVG